MATERKNEISLYNVFLCFVVIFVHINSFCVVGFPQNTFKYNIAMELGRLSAFVVQGFILLSGVKLFLNKKYEVGYLLYVKTRAKAILLPYFISYVFYYVFYMVFYDYPLSPMFILKHFVFGSLVCHYYFIPLLFQFDLLMPLWRKVINRFSPLIVIPASILTGNLLGRFLPSMLSQINPSFVFLYNDRVFTTYISFWVIGCYIGKFYDDFKAIINKNFTFISTFFGFATVAYLYSNYLHFNNIAAVAYINELANIYILTACLFFFAVFIKIAHLIPQRKTLLHLIDFSSYKIYLYHMLVLMLCNEALTHFGIIALGLSTLIRVLVVYGVTPTLFILINKLKTSKNV